MSAEFDYRDTDEIVCPFCGYEFDCSWEYFSNDDETEIECINEDCEKTFVCSRDVSVHYYSSKPKKAR